MEQQVNSTSESKPGVIEARSANDIALSDRKLADRYTVHIFTIKRRRRDGALPAADFVIKGRSYTYLSTIQGFEIGLVRQGAAKVGV